MINSIIYPENFLPIYNNYIYSTDSTFAPNLPNNYRAIVDVYINNSKVGTLKSYPNQYGWCFFRLDRICQDYFSFDIHDRPELGELFYQNDNSVKNIFGVFYEEYGDLSTGTTIYTGDSVTGNTIIAYNGAIPWIGDMSNNYNPQVKGVGTPVKSGLNFTNYWASSYIAEEGLNKLFMTYAPRTLKMDYTDTYYLNIMSDTDDVVGNIEINTYDSTGTLQNTYLDPNPYPIVSLTGVTSKTTLLSVGIGPLDINTRAQALTATPIIIPQTAYYTVQIKNTADTDFSSEIFKVVMNSKKYYQRFRFRWLNSLGAFDSYTFEGRNSATKNVRNSTEFSKLFGYENPIGGYAYENGGRGRKTIYQSVETQYTVFSQFITEAESYWLNELFTSSEVYLEVVDEPKPFQTTYDYNASGLLGISYSSPHYYRNNDVACIIDCDDDTNNTYAGVTVIDDLNVLVATSYVDIPNGFSFIIDNTITLLPIMINSKTYNIKQGINPRNIQVQIDFTLAVEDPKQRG
jgi:hypothetical protein